MSEVRSDSTEEAQNTEQLEHKPDLSAPKGSPRQLSQQLGLTVQDVLSAIEFANLQPSQDESGQVEYPLKSVLSAYLALSRMREQEQNSQLQSVMRSCLDAYQDSVRQMIREENRVAYQIKDMTESRFLEVLGQVSLSLGRVEAFVMQAAKLLSQIDMRLSRSDGILHPEAKTVVPAAAKPVSQTQPVQTPNLNANPTLQNRPMSNAEHWREFESELTRVLHSNGDMAETAISEFMTSAKALLNLGNLELRLNGEHLLGNVRPALMGNSFASMHFSMPSEENILPAFDRYQAWISSERAQGHSAVLLFLILVLNRGPQISWSGFVTTFINEA